MMKKLPLVVLISIFLLSTITFAQNSQTARRNANEYGFRIGLNYSDLDFEDDSIVPNGAAEARYGFMAGFFGVFHLSEAISIQPEIQYSAQGEKFAAAQDSNGIPGRLDTDELKINLLQIPIFLNYTIANRFTISAGPQVGFGVWEWERQDDYEIFQFSAIGGIAYKITDNFSIAARASYGITDAVNANNSSTFEVNNEQLQEPLFVAKAKNHYVQLSVAYQL